MKRGTHVAPNPDREQRLTPAEAVIVPMRVSGMRIKDIALELGRSHHTVSNHLIRAHLKLGVHDVFELQKAWAAREAGQ